MTTSLKETDAQLASEQILASAMQNADAFLEAAGEEIPVLAEHLRRRELQPVLGRMGQLLQGLGSLARLSVELNQLAPGTDKPPLDLGPMTDALRRLVDCQERHDWSAAAATLEQNVGRQIPHWREAIRTSLESHRVAVGQGARELVPSP